MIDAIVFALNIVLPNLFLMGLGFFMQRHGHIGRTFVDEASKLVFNYALPCLLFFSVTQSHVDFMQQINLIVAGLVVTLLLFFGAEWYAKQFIERAEDKGVFVQGVFRSNMGIIGLATVANAYGSQGVSVGAVYMGLLTLVFNILAVITLSRTAVETTTGKQSSESDNTPRTDNVKSANSNSNRTRQFVTSVRSSHWILLVQKMLTNPLIIALVVAFSYKALASSFSFMELPNVITQTGEFLSALALPLALICAGATLDVRSMLNLSGLSMQASIGRIVIAPLLAVAVGLGFGLTGVHMGVLFLMVASPAAAASYVMAKAMGGNEVLAANILAFTTIVSLFAMAIGAAILRGLGLL